MSRSHVLDQELKIQIPSLEPQSAQMSGDCTVSGLEKEKGLRNVENLKANSPLKGLAII